MHSKKLKILGLVFGLVFVLMAGKSFSGGEGDKMVEKRSDVASELFKGKIFFAHQSVGGNILAGVEALHPAAADRIVDIKDRPRSSYPETGLLHARVGRNADPKSKIAEFGERIESEFGGELDVALVKLCYVDINKSTDVDELFAHYRNQMDRLKSKYPGILFVHATVPLTVNSENWKTRLKKLTGLGQLWEYQGNVQRNRYNRLLLAEYKGKEPVFDVAEIESTRLNGERAIFTLQGERYYSLAKELSSDGGHLNSEGRKRVASSFLQLLSELQ